MSNSGPPVPATERQHIFEKFSRIEQGGHAGNAGLGLYFCKRVVEALGGRIEVTETPEWPTSFVLRFPVLW
jgi:signal transduction histidine kinase